MEGVPANLERNLTLLLLLMKLKFLLRVCIPAALQTTWVLIYKGFIHPSKSDSLVSGWLTKFVLQTGLAGSHLMLQLVYLVLVVHFQFHLVQLLGPFGQTSLLLLLIVKLPLVVLRLMGIHRFSPPICKVIYRDVLVDYRSRIVSCICWTSELGSTVLVL